MLFQIRYYQGEESAHDRGFGVAPGNIIGSYSDIKEKYTLFKISKNKYLIKGTLVDLVHKPSGWIDGKDWGNLCIRLISDSKENIELTAKELNLPFDKGAIVDL